MLPASLTNTINISVNISSLLTQAGIKNSTGKVTDHQLDEKDTVFAFHGCFNKLLQILWLETTQIYYLSILGLRSPK